MLGAIRGSSLFTSTHVPTSEPVSERIRNAAHVLGNLIRTWPSQDRLTVLSYPMGDGPQGKGPGEKASCAWEKSLRVDPTALRSKRPWRLFS